MTRSEAESIITEFNYENDKYYTINDKMKTRIFAEKGHLFSIWR